MNKSRLLVIAQIVFAVLVTAIGFIVYGLKSVSLGAVKVEFREPTPVTEGQAVKVEAQPVPSDLTNSASLYRQACTPEGLKKIIGLRVTLTEEISDSSQQPTSSVPPNDRILLLAVAGEATGIECVFGTRYTDRVGQLRKMSGPVTVQGTVTGYDSNTKQLKLQEVELVTSRWKLRSYSYVFWLIVIAILVLFTIICFRLHNNSGLQGACLSYVIAIVVIPILVILLPWLTMTIFDALDLLRPVDRYMALQP